MNAQITAAQAKAASSSQGPLAVIAPKPPPVDFAQASSNAFPHVYGGPENPSFAAIPSFNPPQQLPSPPLLAPEQHPFLDYHPPVLPGELPAHGELYGIPPSLQNLQHDPRWPGVSPSHVPHHVPEPNLQQPTHFPDNEDHQAEYQSAEQPSYWQSDDEASMIDSDDETAPDNHLVHLKSNDLGMELARRLEPHLDAYGVRIRSFAAFADGNILDTYTPSSASSPLNDPQTAAVFWHFVNVTGQSMSLYERQPFDPTSLFEGRPIPQQRPHIWTRQ